MTCDVPNGGTDALATGTVRRHSVSRGRGSLARVPHRCRTAGTGKAVSGRGAALSERHPDDWLYPDERMEPERFGAECQPL